MSDAGSDDEIWKAAPPLPGTSFPIAPSGSIFTGAAAVQSFLVLAVLGCVGAFHSWSLRPEHFFSADDWAWLHRARFFPPADLWTLLPIQIYNDRPAGALFVKTVFTIVGPNHRIFHAVWLTLHLVNVLLAFRLSRRLLGSFTPALLAALVWGTWSVATTAATWVAAIFDVLGLTFVLLTLLLLPGRRLATQLGAALTCFLAIRSKEFSIALPAVAFLLPLEGRLRLDTRFVRQSARRLLPILPVLIVLSLAYLRLYVRWTGPAADTRYSLNPSVGAAATKLAGYLSLMFYGVASPRALLMGFIAIVAAGLLSRDLPLLLGVVGFVAFLGPVLFVPQAPNGLYLYAPSFFLVLALFRLGHLAAARAIGILHGRDIAAKGWFEPLVAVATALLLLGRFPHISVQKNTSAWVLAKTVQYRDELAAVMAAEPALRPGTRFLLVGFPDYFNVFDYGPCYSLMVFYGSRDLGCSFFPSAADIRLPAGSGRVVAVEAKPAAPVVRVIRE